MNKAITTVLVTGATVAGVAGVLVLNPSGASLDAVPGIGSPGTLPGGTSGGTAGTAGGTSGTGTDLRGGFAASGSDEYDDEHGEEDGEDSTAAAPAAPRPTSSARSTSGSTSSGSTSSGSTSTSTTTGKSYTGSTYQSPYGPMQVSLTVSGGKITDIQWKQVPLSDGHSARINRYAAPLLVEQALQAQAASVDGVSGATYTTEGFRTSLQSAIKKAGL